MGCEIVMDRPRVLLRRLPHGVGLPLPAYATEHAAMSMTLPATITETLTQGEMPGAVFALADFDPEPPRKPWRAPLEWDGEAWAEIDPDTGEIIATGTITPYADREELRP